MTRAIAMLLAAIVVLAGAVLYFSNTTVSEPVPAPAGSAKIFMLEIRSNALVGEKTLTVREGDMVTLHIISDSTDEFHLHGYEKEAEVAPGQETTIAFIADATGRYQFELHESGAELGALEVLP